MKQKWGNNRKIHSIIKCQVLKPIVSKKLKANRKILSDLDFKIHINKNNLQSVPQATKQY